MLLPAPLFAPSPGAAQRFIELGRKARRRKIAR